MRDRLIHLGSPQLVIVVVGLLHIVLIAYACESPLWHDIYARAYALPRLEERWGFRFGTFLVPKAGGEYKGIVSVTPGGPLAQGGVRVHDAPGDFTRHGRPGTVVLSEALLASERGEAITLFIVNIDDYAAGRVPLMREIKLPPVQ